MRSSSVSQVQRFGVRLLSDGSPCLASAVRSATLGAVLFALSLGGFANVGHADVYINKEYPITGPNGVVELSAPDIEATNECSTHVYVDSFAPGATIKVYLGTTQIGIATPKPGFAAVPLTKQLHVGDKVTATQTVNGVTSKPSSDAIIGTMPNPLPQPTISPDIYACGRVVPVNNLVSGVTVKVTDTTANVTLGSSFTPNDWGSDWSPVFTSALKANHQTIAVESACVGKPSAPSPSVNVKTDPSPMTPPTLTPPVVGDDTISLSNLDTGALLDAKNTAVSPAKDLGSGYATGSNNWMQLPAPLTASETVAVTETLCAGSTTESQGEKPVSTLDAPVLLGPICPGQAAVQVSNTTLNATLVLFKNGAIVGYGGAAPGDAWLTIAPPNAFAANDSVQVLQYINAITSPKSNSVKVDCTNAVTYHYNSQRTGWNDAEQILTPANVGSSAFGLLQTVALDDQVDSQPLLVTQQMIKDVGKRDVIYVATENNAIDAVTGAVLLSPNFGKPVPMSVLPGQCNNNANNVGITSTPVIDVSAGLMYAITYTYENSAPVYRIHALNLTDLTDKIPSKVITASNKLSDGTTYNFQPQYSRQRSALLEANGNIYAGFASFCDLSANNSRGWLLGWQTGSLTPLAANELTDTQTDAQTPAPPANGCTTGSCNDFFLSSIWMSGYGVAADSSGDLYFVTGNSDTVRANNIQDSAVRMSSDLSTVKDFFTPADFGALDQGDADFGSGGLLVLPDQPGPLPHLAVAAGKAGLLYILNRDSMGGFVPGGPDKPQSVNTTWCHCGPSYFVGSDGVGRVVSSGGTGTQLTTWKVNTSLPVALASEGTSASLFTSSEENGTEGIQDSGFFTTISSNGTQANTAVIWAMSRPDAASKNHVSLYAFNGTASGGNLATLFHHDAGTWPNTGGNANIVPLEANGKVYVATYQQLAIFGLTPSAKNKRRIAQMFRPLAAPEAPPPPPITGSRFYGTIASINGSRLTVTLRTGDTLTVDLTTAAKNFQTVIPAVGELVTVTGNLSADGTLNAETMLRAKGKASWAPDKR
jgi:hypothetical protein